MGGAVTLSPGAIVKDKDKPKNLTRRVAADSLLPPLKENDDISIDFRRVIIEREALGLPRLSPRALNAIREKGYDAYFIDQMNSYTKIGLSLFHKLAAIQRVDLTTEYIVFNHYRDRLKPDCRRRIAILVLSKMQKTQ